MFAGSRDRILHRRPPSAANPPVQFGRRQALRQPRERALPGNLLGGSSVPRKPVHAVRASAPPTLMRRTPSPASSATVVKWCADDHVDGRGRDRADDGADLIVG